MGQGWAPRAEQSGSDPGFDPGFNPGFDPGVGPGFDPISDPSFDPSFDPGSDPGGCCWFQKGRVLLSRVGMLKPFLSKQALEQQPGAVSPSRQRFHARALLECVPLDRSLPGLWVLRGKFKQGFGGDHWGRDGDTVQDGGMGMGIQCRMEGWGHGSKLGSNPGSKPGSRDQDGDTAQDRC